MLAGKYSTISVALAFTLAIAGGTPQSRRQKPEPAQPPTQSNPCKSAKDSETSNPFTVQFNVLVTDINGQPKDDVDKRDFKILEDGVQQELSFLLKREGPLEYGLLVDTSGSLRAQFNMVMNTANAFVSANSPIDEMFLVRFISADKIEMIQDWTSDQVLLRKRLDNLFIEGGQSAIVDAVYESAKHLFERQKTDRVHRRAGLVLITDGEDRASYYNERQLLKLLRDLNVQVFVIGFTRDLQKGASRKATNLLTRLAQESGGHALFPSNIAELADAVRAIRQEVSGQYFVGYTSTNQTRDNGIRQIKIEIADRSGRDRRLVNAHSSFVALCP